MTEVFRDTSKDAGYCAKCNHGYAVGPHVCDVDQLAALKRYHAEIVESDGAECEAMGLTRWAIDRIEQLQRELDVTKLRALSAERIMHHLQKRDSADKSRGVGL